MKRSWCFYFCIGLFTDYIVEAFIGSQGDFYMLFEKETYVRYSEVDKDGLIKIDALVNHLQDIVMLHADEVGAGIAQVIDMGTVWFISTWQIEIITPPRIYDKIILKTNPYEFKGFFGNRNVWIENEEGEILVRTNSIWVYLDVKTKVPKRIDDAAVKPYLPLEPKLEMSYSSRKIAMPENFEPSEPVRVHYGQLDTNGHVNNCQYIKTAMDVIEIKDMPRQIRAEYKKSALYGDVFYPYIHREEKAIYVDLRDKDNAEYATVVFEF